MKDEIYNIIARQLRIDAAEITDETDVMDDLGADSLDIVEMLIAIEEGFGVAVPDEDIPALKKVSEIIGYVEARYKEKASDVN